MTRIKKTTKLRGDNVLIIKERTDITDAGDKCIAGVYKIRTRNGQQYTLLISTMDGRSVIREMFGTNKRAKLDALLRLTSWPST